MTDSKREALAMAEGLTATPNAIESVAKRTDPIAAQWAFTQWDLRRRASSKFALAHQMLFTREGLEQATHETVAAFRASRFPEGAPAADLTCGIGADLIALARRGPAIGFDIDHERLEYAKWNLAAHGLEAELRPEDCIRSEWDFTYAVADPARRAGGRRVLDPESFAPNPKAIASKMVGLELGCIKLSPMLADRYLEDLGGRVEFWSFGGECREAAVWLGESAGSGFVAVHIASGETLESGPPPFSGDMHEAFFEADPAAIRTHGLAQLADRLGLVALGDSNGYLSGPSHVRSVWLRPYRLLEELPRDLRAIKRRLAELGCSTPVIKSRAKGVDPVALAKLWKRTGDRPAVVAVFAEGKSLRFVLIEPDP